MEFMSRYALTKPMDSDMRLILNQNRIKRKLAAAQKKDRAIGSAFLDQEKVAEDDLERRRRKRRHDLNRIRLGSRAVFACNKCSPLDREDRILDLDNVILKLDAVIVGDDPLGTEHDIDEIRECMDCKVAG